MDLLQRNFFIFSFIFISLILWKTWEYESKINNQQKNKQDITFNSFNENYDFKNKKYVILENDVISIIVNRYGGNIEKVILLNYKNSLNSKKLFHLLDTQSDFIYQAQSGFIINNKFNKFAHVLYDTNNKFYKLNNSNKELRVPFFYIDKNGIKYIKIFTLKYGKYYVEIEHTIHNNTNKSLNVSTFGQLTQTIKPPIQEKKNNVSLQTYRGSAYFTENEKYKKCKFDSINKNNLLNIRTMNGWVAMLQQYFISAWIPIIPKMNTIYTKISQNKTITSIGYKSKKVSVGPFSNYIFKSNLWLGPENQDEMSLLSPNLNLTIDYGIFWWLSQPLFKLLKFFHIFINNWGGSIIAITILIRFLMYPLTKSQYISMAKMRKLQPKINEIKEKFQEDKKRMSQEMILLYKNEKINPLKGCLPLFIQMPIFLALYYMLINAVELRHAPFLFWIHDLSGKDPYFILPIMMGVTMFIIQSISPNSVNDPLQKKIMHVIPILFTIFFLWFPSGLVLYYIISNVVTILQQKFIYKKL